MNTFPLLSLLIALPAVGALAVGLLPGRGPGCSRRLALLFSLATLALALVAAGQFDRTGGGLQYVEHALWIPSLGAAWSLGIDGLGLVLVLLAGIVTPLALALPAPETPAAAAPPRVYFALILLLEAMAIGVFTSQNFVPFFLFWELSLVPSFLLIKIWGGRWRSAAAMQFFLFTLAGGVAMLAGFLALLAGSGSLEFAVIGEAAREVGGVGELLSVRLGGQAGVLGQLVFWLIFAGFAVKVPVLPLHTWLPDTYAEAPVGATMMLTGLLSKMGVYGILRILWPLFPVELQAAGPVLLVLAVATIVLPTLAALAQTDMKRILAYSSINHLGYCLLGIFAVTSVVPAGAVSAQAALSGVFLQVFNHGLTAAVLFGFVGLIEVRSGGLRGLDDFGGLRAQAPVLAGLMGVALFASLGLPGLNGFVGEFLVFRGAFGLTLWAAVVSLPALLFTAVFLLRILARVFSGPLNPKWQGFSDLSLRERVVFTPAILLMMVLGFFPSLLLDLVNATVTALLEGRLP